MAKQTKSRLDVDEDLIRRLAGLLDETGLGEIEIADGDAMVRVAKAGSAVTAYAAPAASAPTASAPAAAAPAEQDHMSHPGAVKSPMVGIVYMSPDPNSPKFVNVGDTVKAGDTLLLIEAMKVFNPIAATNGGTVKLILVSDGTPVEYGEPLVIIE